MGPSDLSPGERDLSAHIRTPGLSESIYLMPSSGLLASIASNSHKTPQSRSYQSHFRD